MRSRRFGRMDRRGRERWRYNWGGGKSGSLWRKPVMNDPTRISETTEPPLSDDEGPIPRFPPLPVDPVTGRLLPMSDEEREARRAAAIRAIKAIGQITDETE